MVFNDAIPNRLLLLLSFVVSVVPAHICSADLLCLKVKGSKVTSRQVTTAKCPKGFTKLANTALFAGAPGATGSTGADGKLGVWGSGVDGDVTFDSSVAIDPNKQYRNVTIAAGTSVSMVQGQTLRCTGTLTISGLIFVNAANTGGSLTTVTANHYVSASLAPHPGISQPAGNSECGLAGVTKDAGVIGLGMSLNAAKAVTSVNRQTSGGGGGGSAGSFGGSGGGGIALRCKEGISITSTGTISAPGQDASGGSGGGGGGIVILASQGEISHAGTINVSGGDGGAASASSCPGGGGGGGFVHLIASSVANTGTIDVTGGAFGPNAVAVTDTIHCGGGGGGASYGSGGQGYQVDSAPGNACVSPTFSVDGTVITTTVAGGDVAGLLL
jgi:hypothetical protein